MGGLLAQKQKPSASLKWWILSFAVIYIGIFIFMFWLNFVWYYYLIVYSIISTLIALVYLIIRHEKVVKQAMAREVVIIPSAEMKKLAFQIVKDELMAGEPDEIYEMGTNYENIGEQKIPIFTLWYKEKGSTNNFVVCINHNDMNANKAVSNITKKEELEAFRKQVAGTQDNIITTENTMTDPTTGRQTTQIIKKPATFMKKEEEKEDSTKLN